MPVARARKKKNRAKGVSHIAPPFDGKSSERKPFAPSLAWPPLVVHAVAR